MSKVTPNKISVKTLILIIFLIVQVEFFVLAYRTEHNDQRIHASAVLARAVAEDTAQHSFEDKLVGYKVCLIRNTDNAEINNLLEEITQIERDNPANTPAILARWEKAFGSIHLTIRDCGKFPTKESPSVN